MCLSTSISWAHAHAHTHEYEHILGARAYALIRTHTHAHIHTRVFTYAHVHREFHPYSSTLQRVLGNVCVDHVGLSGWTTTQMVSTMDDESCVDVCRRDWKGLRAKLREQNYSHCVLLAGTNDVSQDSALNIFKNIRTLASAASARGCETLVMTIPELAAETTHAQIKTTRSQVNTLLLQSDQEVIDIASLLPYASAAKADRDFVWEPDGLHLRPVCSLEKRGTLLQNTSVPILGSQDASHSGQNFACLPG